MNFPISTFCRIFIVFMFSGLGAGVRANITEHEFFVVSLDGKNTDQFLQVQSEFQDLIATLATNFCDANGFTKYDIINASSVEINSVKACPGEWPSAELCVNINFSVPIAVNSSSYELSSHHLSSLWKTHTSLQLSELALKEYEIPSNTTILILWISVTGAMFVFFLLILVLVVRTKFIENYIRRRGEMLGSSNRSWLNQQNTKQLVPPFFYPEPPSEKHMQPHSFQYVTDISGKHHMFGIENPGYDPERGVNCKLENQTKNSTVMVDDFDSEDETIYPPSPLSRQAQHRNDRGTNVAVSQDELETAF